MATDNADDDLMLGAAQAAAAVVVSRGTKARVVVDNEAKRATSVKMRNILPRT